MLKIEVADHHALVGILLDAGWLGADEALDRREVERAVSGALAELAQWNARR